MSRAKQLISSLTARTSVAESTVDLDRAFTNLVQHFDSAVAGLADDLEAYRDKGITYTAKTLGIASDALLDAAQALEAFARAYRIAVAEPPVFSPYTQRNVSEMDRLLRTLLPWLKKRGY